MNTSWVVNTKPSEKRNVLLLSTTNWSCNERAWEAETSHHQVLRLHPRRNRHCWSENGKLLRQTKISKWTIAAFSYIFDVARINAITLSRHNQKKSAKTPSTDAFMSGWKLAMSLIQSQLHHRCMFSSGLQKYMQKAIAKFFGVMIERLSITPGKRKCCWICLEKIESVDKKNKKGSIGKTISRCVKWDKHFAQTIFKGFVRHFSSKHYYSLLFASKKEAIEEEVDNEYECYL